MNWNRRLLKGGGWLMVTSVLLTSLSAFVAYGMDDSLTLGQQVAAHMLTIIAPVGLKFGYVVMLYARQQMGLQAI